MSPSPNLNGHDPGSAALELRRRFTRNLRVYYLFYGATGFLIWMPIWMIYLIDGRGMSLTQVATMESLFWITIVVAEVPTGAIADRWGRRVSLFLGGCGFTIASVAFAFSSTYLLLSISYILLAVSMTLYSGAGHALLFDTLRQLRRTNEYEKHVGRSEAFSFTTMIVAILLGGPLTAIVGFSNTILIGAIFMAGTAAVALMLREPPRHEAAFALPPHSQNGAQNGAPLTPAIPRSVLANMLLGALTVWRRKTLLAIIAFATFMVVILELPAFFIQPFVRDQGIDPQAAIGSGFLYSVLQTPPMIGLVIGSLLAAGIAARFGERRSLRVILAAAALLFIPLLLWNSLWVITAIGLLSVLHGMIRPIATGYINRRIASDQRATVLSMYELSTGLLMAICVSSVGSIVDAFSFQWAFAVCLVALVAVGSAFALIWRRAHDREQTRNGISLSSTPAPQATIPTAANGTSTNGTSAAHPAQPHHTSRS